ncbi:MAG: hypothetical protein R2856_29470 [Caldilineaceae bacterium]
MPITQHLIVDEFGSFIAKKSERLSVTCQGENASKRRSCTWRRCWYRSRREF